MSGKRPSKVGKPSSEIVDIRIIGNKRLEMYSQRINKLALNAFNDGRKYCCNLENEPWP